MGDHTVTLLILVPTLVIASLLVAYYTDAYCNFTSQFGCHTDAPTALDGPLSVADASVGTIFDKTSNLLIGERLSLTSFRRVKRWKAVRCGKTRNTLNARIVDGRIATITDFPWIVSIQREKSYWFGFKDFRHSCGGSIIAPSWIVTASHCFYGREDDLNIRIIAGADNMNYLYRAQIRGVTKVIVHENFNIDTYNNDVALVKVKEPFVLDSSFSYVGAACLERNVPIIPYDIAQVCGFGATEFRGKTQSHLYSTEIAIIDQATCNSSFDNMITENMICAGGMIAHKRDACSGDSGGPLMVENNDHLALIGVVSFGNDCAMKDYPGIYTRLNNYYDWIVEKIDEPLIDP